MNQIGKLLGFRVGPVRRASMRRKPLDSVVRVEFLLTQYRMRATQGDHAAGKAIDLLVLFQVGPIKPTDLVVLTVGVIVAALSAAKFVTAEQHRYASRDQECQQEVLDLAFPQGFYSGIRRLAFHSVVLAIVGVGSVVVVLSVCIVVL